MPGRRGRSGGRREGAGRKPKQEVLLLDFSTDDPAEFFRAMMRATHLPLKLRAEAARDLLELQRDERPPRPGKKEALAARAEALSASGRLAPMATPPRLKVVK